MLLFDDDVFTDLRIMFMFPDLAEFSAPLTPCAFLGCCKPSNPVSSSRRRDRGWVNVHCYVPKQFQVLYQALRMQCADEQNKGDPPFEVYILVKGAINE